MLPLSVVFTSILGCLDTEDTGLSKEPSSEPNSPTSEPTSEVSIEPSSPSAEPTSEVSTEPSAPTSEPSSPTSEPTSEVSTEPSSPTTEPSSPTSEPSSPTSEPTSEVSTEPSSPTSEPTSEVSTEPSSPTSEPTSEVSTEPSSPTTEPSSPTSEPSSPTSEPTSEVSTEPSSPTSEPTSEIFEQDCSTWQGYCQYYEETYAIDVSDYTAQLDASGNLTSEGCFALCQLGNLQLHNTYAMCYDVCEDGGMNADGTYSISCGYYNNCVIEGRGTECIKKKMTGQGENVIGAWFARANHAEHSSVFAFAQLRRDLIQLQAPKHLLQKIDTAICEEAQHTSMMGDFARANQGHLIEVQFDGFLDSRSLWDIAVENLLEGCINESYAALQALYQSRHAQTDFLKACFAKIATDECKHAEIAREVHQFLLPLLTKQQREELQCLQLQQWNKLQKAVSEQAIPTDLKILGLPSPEKASFMVQELSKAA